MSCLCLKRNGEKNGKDMEIIYISGNSGKDVEITHISNQNNEDMKNVYISKSNNENINIEIHLEQLLVYFLFTYFPGAVYDGEIYAKVQLAVYCVWMIWEIWMVRWLKNEKFLELEEMTKLVYRFSRES